MFEKRKIENASPQQLRGELERCIQHVLGYDPDKLEFALMVTGHGETNGGTHIHSMLGGSPQALAIAVMGVMDELIKHNPILATFFLLNVIQRMHNSNPDLDDVGGPDVENQVKEILAKIMGNTNQ